jgi:hypothetical protein
MDVIQAHHEKAPKPMQEHRTQTLLGQKSTFAVAHTSSGATHSYTINAAISMAGKLGQKVCICFQEPEEKFGTIVQKKH